MARSKKRKKKAKGPPLACPGCKDTGPRSYLRTGDGDLLHVLCSRCGKKLT